MRPITSRCGVSARRDLRDRCAGASTAPEQARFSRTARLVRMLLGRVYGMERRATLGVAPTASVQLEEAMKATSLLEKQHRKVRMIFNKLEKGRGEPLELLAELANDLAAHMAIEQEIFYPAVQKLDGDTVREAYEEHALGEVALKRLLATDPDNDFFKARVVAAKELIEHHAKEEEEVLFPKVERKLGDEKLLALGKQMKARFDEVVEAGFEASVPSGYAKTSADASRKLLSAAAS
jgi:hemerythrin superfamily protein